MAPHFDFFIFLLVFFIELSTGECKIVLLIHSFIEIATYLFTYAGSQNKYTRDKCS